MLVYLEFKLASKALVRCVRPPARTVLTGHFDSRHGNEALEDVLRQSDARVPHQAPRVRVRVRVLQVLRGRGRVGEGIVVLEGVVVVFLVVDVDLSARVVVDLGIFALQQRLQAVH